MGPGGITTSGTLTSHETWSGVIVLTGDVTVPENRTLTIEAGTVIRATPLSDDQNNGEDPSRIELIIRGTLDLLGSPTAPVTFTSHRTTDPLAGDWYGIRLTNWSNSAFPFHDAIVEYGVRGIWSDIGSHQDVVDLIVPDMTGDGIYLQYGLGERDNTDPGMLISGNDVQRTGAGKYGILVQWYASHESWNDSLVIIEGNTTDDTGLCGICAFPYYAERTELFNNSTTNADFGIVFSGSSSDTYTNRCEIYDNQVADASVQGIDIGAGRSVLVKGNTVTDGLSGISAIRTNEIRIIRNDLTGGTGAWYHRNRQQYYRSGPPPKHRDRVRWGRKNCSSNLPSAVALYNIINGSGDDAILSTADSGYGVPRMHWNNIQGSTGYDARTDENPVDMRHNYWDRTNGEMLAEGYPSEISKILDIEDDNSLGRVDYQGVELTVVDTNVTLESRFIWPSDGGNIKNRTTTLEGTAYADAGVQMVQVSTDGGMTWLPAGGGDLWTFPFSPVADGPQTFLCRVTDNDSNVEITTDSITVTFDSSSSNDRRGDTG